MNTDIELNKCIQVWRSENPELRADHVYGAGHPSDKLLYEMALADGIKNAEAEVVAHLALCAKCLRRWAKLRKALSDMEDPESGSFEGESFLTWGMLEAAADDKPVEALRLKSACGKFVLGVLPRVGNSDSGMITLEVVESEAVSHMEGRKATVRDKNGRLILQGRIHQARVARKIERLSNVKLAKWTVVVE
jgi:hypothetical protein